MKLIYYLTAFIFLCLWMLAYALGYESSILNVLPVLTVGALLVALSKLYATNE